MLHQFSILASLCYQSASFLTYVLLAFQMAGIADWIFESVLQFLKSPLWTTPVDTFIETHCDKFDPDEEENKLEFTTLHHEFRTLVDELLSDFLKELGVDVQDFVEACRAAPKDHEELCGMITDYLVAMDDFPSFRAMMEHRQSELELEAIYQHAKYAPGAADEDDDIDEDEQFLLEMAIHASLGSEDVLMKQLAMEDARMLHELAVKIALEHERLLKEQLDADSEEEKRQLEKQQEERIAKLQAEAHQQRQAKVEERLKEISAPKALGEVSLTRSPLRDRGNCNVFGSNKPALPGLATKTAVTGPISQPPLTKLVEDVRTAKREVSDGTPSAEELAEKEKYFKALGEKLRAKKVESRSAELKALATELEAAPVASATNDAALSDEQKAMRVALARRFKEDLILESRRPMA